MIVNFWLLSCAGVSEYALQLLFEGMMVCRCTRCWSIVKVDILNFH